MGEPHLQGNTLGFTHDSDHDRVSSKKVDRDMLPFYGDTVQLCEKNDHVMTTLQDMLLFRSAVY